MIARCEDTGLPADRTSPPLFAGAAALHDRRDELDRGLFSADDPLEDSDEAAMVHGRGASTATVRSFAGRPILTTRRASRLCDKHNRAGGRRAG